MKAKLINDSGYCPMTLGNEYEVKQHPTLPGCFELYHTHFAKWRFEVIEDEPAPAILTGRVETKEDIEERLGADGRDPLTKAVKEIMQYQEDLHKVVGARAQQIQMNQLILSMIDIFFDDYDIGHKEAAFEKLVKVREFIQAGTVG